MSDEISRLETSFVRHSIYLTYQYVFLLFPLMTFDNNGDQTYCTYRYNKMVRNIVDNLF